MSMLISIVLWLLFGAVIGWLAGLIMKADKSIIVNIIIGMLGAIAGGFIASFLGFGSVGGTFSFNIINILISIGGACLLIFLARLLRIMK